MNEAAASSLPQNIEEIWNTADCVCFDVDSTVCVDEGIDVLAEFCGVGKAVADLTRNAMGGNILFQDALAARLNLMKPSQTLIEKCLHERPPELSSGMENLAKRLQSRGVAIYLISGGFRQMIAPVANILGISESNIIANNIRFNEHGDYKDFDPEEPTSKSGGKPRAVQNLINENDFKNVIMIGDGATDAEAKPPAKAFIAYTGNIRREAACNKADYICHNFNALT